MRSDGGMLRYLLNRNAPVGSGARRDLAFGFDGTNDYISSNATIGRTGYDMNVSGNVSTGSDGDGSYFWINGNRSAGTGTNANIQTSTTPVYNQGTSFSISCKAKVIAFGPSGDDGLFGSNADAAIYFTNTGNLVIGLNGSTRVDVTSVGGITLGTAFTAHLVYDRTVGKIYAYKNGTLLNSGGTTAPTTFSTDSRRLGDNGLISGTTTSANKYIYHTAIRSKALTQAEVDADIALGNTAKNDPSIVAYYIPENLQFNTDYITTKDFSNASRVKTGTTVTSGIADLRGGTNAYTLTMSAGAGNGVLLTNNTVTGSSLASQTFIMKVFAWTTSGTATIRLRISHNGVATYYSTNQTITTTPQEFTFTQALTSSTSGTGMLYGIEVGTAAGAATVNAYYPTGWLTNQTLRDESPNIGGFIGWKTQKVLSCRGKPNIDAANTIDAQMLMLAPRALLHVRNTSNTVRIRNDTRLRANEPTYNLGTGFRDKVHILGVQSVVGNTFTLKLYVNGVMVSSTTHVDAPVVNYSNVLWAGRRSSTYYSGNERDIREYTFTGLFIDADALAIHNGGEPISAGITKYLHYKPPVGELGTTTQDQSTNDRDGTLNGGVTRDYI